MSNISRPSTGPLAPPDAGAGNGSEAAALPRRRAREPVHSPARWPHASHHVPLEVEPFMGAAAHANPHAEPEELAAGSAPFPGGQIPVMR